MTMATANEQQFTSEQYHRLPQVGHSMLDAFRESRKRYHAKYVAQSLPPEESTPSQKLGTAVHTAVCEPHLFDEQYMVLPDLTVGIVRKDGTPYDNVRNTKEYKARLADFMAEHRGIELVEREWLDKVRGMQAAILYNDCSSKLFNLNGPTEHTIFWTDPLTGIECKSRRDKWAEDFAIIADLKTCVNVSPEGFARAAASLGYFRQAAWYARGHEVVYGERPSFIFVCVQNEPPYEVAHYELDDAAMELGDAQNMAALDALAKCIETGDWSAPYERQIVKLSLPRYVEYSDQYQSY